PWPGTASSSRFRTGRPGPCCSTGPASWASPWPPAGPPAGRLTPMLTALLLLALAPAGQTPKAPAAQGPATLDTRTAAPGRLPLALSFMLGKGRLTDEFEVTPAGNVPYGTSNDYKLSLAPKQPQATYKSILFVVDPKSFYVTESVLVNAQGDINDITFSDLK